MMAKGKSMNETEIILLVGLFGCWFIFMLATWVWGGRDSALGWVGLIGADMIGILFLLYEFMEAR